MFLQGHLYQASFPQVQFQMFAPNANKQCILIYEQEDEQQHVFFNIKRVWAYLAA